MNSKFKKRNFKSNRYENNNSKPIELGKFIHMCEDLAVIKLTGLDIPFPNAQVLDKENKLIGKVEEVLGPQNEVYVVVKLDSMKESFDSESVFYCYENKFIPKERFMERSEVEKKKEEKDKTKGRENNKGRENKKGTNDAFRGRHDRDSRDNGRSRNDRDHTKPNFRDKKRGLTKMSRKR